MSSVAIASRINPAQITLRPASDDDRNFLHRVYAGTREDELARIDWTPTQKAAFVQSQFDTQDRYYRAHYDTASFDVVLCDGVPAGRLYVARGVDEIRIVDISLLREFQRRGIGGALLQALLDEATRTRKAIRIHVEKFNPAVALYTRLGFVLIADLGVYLFMESMPK